MKWKGSTCCEMQKESNKKRVFNHTGMRLLIFTELVHRKESQWEESEAARREPSEIHFLLFH